jgi:2-methylcitrate dehydratase PrpD
MIMSIIERLADFNSKVTFDDLPVETREKVKLHILDTVGSMLAGPQTSEGIAIGKLVSGFQTQGDVPVFGYPMRSTLMSAIITECAATRCTEMDDYHIESLVTPGSVIVPTALSLVSGGYLRDPNDFLTAVAIGYEMFIRLGIAVDGPRVLYKGIWPTYLGAAFGSAAVTAKALELNDNETANALATALALSTGTRIAVPKGISSRCLTLGISAQNGVIAAFSARERFTGDVTLLDKGFGQAHGLSVEQDKLVSGLGQMFHIEQAGIKPFPVAGQALSAIEAFRSIVTANKIAPESIQEISVWVPKSFVAMIDRPKLPESQIESILSAQYQIALVTFVPDGLLDVKREQLIRDDRIAQMIKKIHVKSADELEEYSSSSFPARVEVQTKGQRYSLEILHPKGHPNNKFSWQEVIDKFKWVTIPIVEEERANQLVQLIRELDESIALTNVLNLLTELQAE